MQAIPSFLQGIQNKSYDPNAEVNKPLFSPSKTELNIKSIAQEKVQQPVVEKITSQELFSDTKKIQDAKGISSDEALLNTMKYYKEKGLEVEGVDLDSEIQALMPQQEVEEVEDNNFLQDIGGAMKIESKFDIDESDNTTLVGSMKNSLKNLANQSRFAFNMPGDTIEFVGDIGELIMNPIDTAKGLIDVTDAVAAKIGITEDGEEKEAIRAGITQSLSDNFGSVEKAMETIAQNPFDSITTIFGGATLAKPVLTKVGASEKVLQGLDELAEFSNPLKIAQAEYDLAKGVVGGTVGKATGVVGDVGKTLTAKMSGLNPETLTQLFKNPDLVKQGILSKEGTAKKVVGAIDKRIDEVGDMGKEYQTVREYTGPIAVEKITPETILEKFNIKVDESGKLDFSNSSIGTTGNKNAIQSAYDLIKNRTIESGDNILSLRQALDDTINYKTEATGAAEKIVRAMRGNVDDVAKESIPGLRDLDAKFGTEIQELSKIKSLIYDKAGNLKDTYIADIARLVTERNSVKLERIEQLVPELGDEIRALKALQDVELAKGNKVGTYVQSGILGGGLGSAALMADPLIAIASVVLTSPTVVSNMVRAAGYSSKIVSSIAQKIKDGIKLAPSEAIAVGKAIQSQINTQASKAKDSLGSLADDVIDNTIVE